MTKATFTVEVLIFFENNQLCLFADHFTKIKTFLLLRIFVLQENTKFLLTLQIRHFTYILLEKVLNCTLFSSILVPELQ